MLDNILDTNLGIGVIVAILVMVLAAIVGTWASRYERAGPDEVLVISGRRRRLPGAAGRGPLGPERSVPALPAPLRGRPGETRIGHRAASWRLAPRRSLRAAARPPRASAARDGPAPCPCRHARSRAGCAVLACWENDW